MVPAQRCKNYLTNLIIKVQCFEDGKGFAKSNAGHQIAQINIAGN
jgi:hypothetical protein